MGSRLALAFEGETVRFQRDNVQAHHRSIGGANLKILAIHGAPMPFGGFAAVRGARVTQAECAILQKRVFPPSPRRTKRVGGGAKDSLRFRILFMRVDLALTQECRIDRLHRIADPTRSPWTPSMTEDASTIRQSM